MRRKGGEMRKWKRGRKRKTIITYKTPLIGIVSSFFQRPHQKLDDHGRETSKL